MRITLSSTPEIVEIGGGLQARLWEGETAAGVRCVALIVRLGTNELDRRAEFESDLREQAPPVVLAPARLIL